MKFENKAEMIIHSSACLIGGFIGAYAVLNRGGVLGSAQTLNMIEIIFAVLGRNFFDFFIRIGGLILYILGVFVYSILSHKTKINMQRYALIVDMAGFISLCLIPDNIDSFLSLYPIFFIISTQWSVFHGMNGYNSSTIFSTNNLRQMTLAVGDYLCTKNKESLKKAGFFANTILWFHIGVASAYFLCMAFGIYSILFCFIPALLSMLLTFRDSKIFTEIRFLARKSRKPETV